jgi:phage terminase Nu1 subunit (DNA packaging protein)
MRQTAGSDTPGGAPAPPGPGEFVDARRLAAVLGVSTTTIKRWTAAGMPSETWGMKRIRRFRVADVLAWARAREVTAADRTSADGR